MSDYTKIYDGYVILNHNRGIKTLELYRDADGIYAMVDDELADDVESLEEFKEQYGDKVLERVQVEGWVLIDTVWDESSS